MSHKIVCVTPTVRPECHAAFVKAWASLFEKHNVTLVTVWDGDSPLIETVEFVGRNIVSTGPKCKTFLYEPWSANQDLFCRRTDACRNIGFVVAAQLKPDYVLTLDDDVAPCDAVDRMPECLDPIQAHIDALCRRVPLGWMNTAHDTDLYLRGVPYGIRDEAPVMLSHGVWVGTPDFDGETQLRLETGGPGMGNWGPTPAPGVPYSLPYYVGSIPRGVLFPLCFVPTAEVTMSDGSRKAISDVKVNDRVFSKGGESHKVLRVMENRHNGDIIKVRVAGRDTYLECTPTHSLLVLRNGNSEPEWVEAQHVTTDDMLATPVIRETAELSQPSLSTCKLLGYFLAEGNYDKYSPTTQHRNAGTYKDLAFTFGTEGTKDAIRDCCECLTNLGVGYRLEYPKESATVVVTKNCYELVSLLRDTYYVGEWAHGKLLPLGVYRWDVQSKRALLAAYWAGDGCFSTITRIKGTTQYQSQAKTRSRTMALQIQLLMQSLGFPANVSRLSPYKQSEEAWAVSINGTRAREFNDFLNGGPLPENGKRKYDHAHCDGSFVYYRVKQVARTKYEGPVYNLTVEDDHSYLVEGLTVKNCGMNVMVCRDALPYLYYAPMGADSGVPDLHRFADIFMGVYLKKWFDVLGWACVTGYSTVLHTRKSDATKNFNQERLGRTWMEALYGDREQLKDTRQFDEYMVTYAEKRLRYQQLIEGLLCHAPSSSNPVTGSDDSK